MPSRATGFHRSGAAFRSLFSPEPADPAKLWRPASVPAVLDVTGGSGPGRGHWFFTPAPSCFAASRLGAADQRTLPDGPWLALGIAAAPSALSFGSIHFEPGERAFSIRLAYEGQTSVLGRFDSLKPETTRPMVRRVVGRRPCSCSRSTTAP